MGLRLVQRHVAPHLIENRIPVLPLFHIDKIDNDQPTDVSQAYLPSDLRRGLAVYVEYSVVLVALVLVGAGVYVDGDEGFGFVDDDRAS